MAYGDFKDLTITTASDIILRDKAFNITKNPQYDGYDGFLLCVVDIFSKYAWVISLKDKKGNTFTNASHKILDESNRKPNKI